MLEELMQKKRALYSDIYGSVQEEFDQLKEAADTLAESATNIKGQGYPIFINAREDLFQRVDNIRRCLQTLSL